MSAKSYEAEGEWTSGLWRGAGDLARWAVVLAVFSAALMIRQERQHTRAAFWFRIWRTLATESNADNVEFVAQEIGDYCRTEAELDFYYDKFFLNLYVARTLEPEDALSFHQLKVELAEELPGVNPHYLALCRHRTDCLQQGWEASRNLAADRPPPFERLDGLGLAARAAHEVAQVQTWPRELTLTLDEFVKLVELQLFEHDLRRELFLARELADLRLALSWRAAARDKPFPWPAGWRVEPRPAGAQPAWPGDEQGYVLLPAGAYKSQVSENLAPLLHQARLANGLRSLLAATQSNRPLPVSVCLSLRNIDGADRSWVFQGFVEGDKLHIVMLEPRLDARRSALLAAARAMSPASVADGVSTPTLTPDEAHRAAALARELDLKRARPASDTVTTAALATTDSAAPLSGAGLRRMLPAVAGPAPSAKEDRTPALLEQYVRRLFVEPAIEDLSAHYAFLNDYRQRRPIEEKINARLRALALPVNEKDAQQQRKALADGKVKFRNPRAVLKEMEELLAESYPPPSP